MNEGLVGHVVPRFDGLVASTRQPASDAADSGLIDPRRIVCLHQGGA